MFNIFYLLIASSGFAALSWEVIWQLKSSLALGVSAYGTALTLAVMMGGMGLGSLLMGKALRRGLAIPTLRLYGSFEMLIGLSGLLLNSAFLTLEKVDSWAYTIMPSSVAVVGIIAIFGLPTLCMGATIPLFGLIAERLQVSITKLYAWNTLGAAASVLLVAFVLIPLFGVTHTIWIIASVNIVVGVIAWLLGQYKKPVGCQLPLPGRKERVQATIDKSHFIIVFVSGFAIFTLEIAWFRSLACVFPNTTDIFAIILACVLIALAIAAKRITSLKQKKKLLGTQLCFAGMLILIMTPIIERADVSFALLKQLAAMKNTNSASMPELAWLFNPDTYTLTGLAIFLYIVQILLKFFFVFLILAPPMILLGSAFPWILSHQLTAHDIGKLYAINTLAAILGSIIAAWLLLPTLGFAKTAWLAAVIVIITGVAITPGLKRLAWSALSITALIFAICFETGIGKTRAQGFFATDNKGDPAKVLAFFEGPQTTVSAVEYNDKTRVLLINSASAALESSSSNPSGAHYMAWMGHLPMLLQADPKRALVICFGTGQTANAVRKENPQALDIVDVDTNVFKLATYFKSNENILYDSRVKTIVMDGRAYLRRVNKNYDVITLEPMPPNTIGVNALYSREFYQLAQNRLTEQGIIAQWLPLHVVTPLYTASIVKTFIDVFPNAILWFDPISQTGILLGAKNNDPILASNWPGFTRAPITRDLTAEVVQQNILFDAKALKQYASFGKVISDDNQLLAYGETLYVTDQPLQENLSLVKKIRAATARERAGL